MQSSLAVLVQHAKPWAMAETGFYRFKKLYENGREEVRGSLSSLQGPMSVANDDKWHQIELVACVNQ